MLWGALFCLPFGFSYTALRVSSLAAGLGGLIGVYLLLRELGAGRRIAVLGALTVAVNPIYFSLSNTFMTEVPFFALCVFCILAFTRALGRRSAGAYAAGLVLACMAVLLRQSAMVLAPAFGVAYLFRERLSVRSVVVAAVPTLAAGGVLLAYQRWLSETGRLPELYSLQAPEMMGFFTQEGALYGAWVVTLAALAYLGLFLFPLLVPQFAAGPKRLWRIGGTVALGCVIFACIRPIGWHGGMPISVHPGDIMTPHGLGPLTLTDTTLFGLPNYPLLPRWLWVVVTAVSCLGASMLLILFVRAAVSLAARRKESGGDRPLVALMVAGVLFTLAPVVMVYFFAYFDRYFLPMLPFATGMLALTGLSKVRLTRGCTAALIAMLILAGGFSVGLTHDYLAWNRARWYAINELLDDGVAPADIDGGYEYSGLYDYEARHLRGWFHPPVEKYAVTFGPMPDYRVAKVYSYRKLVPPRRGRIYVLTRDW